MKMELIQLQIIVFLVIFKAYLVAHAHGEKGNENNNDKIFLNNLKAEKLKFLQPPLVDQNENDIPNPDWKLHLKNLKNKGVVWSKYNSQHYVPCRKGWFLFGDKCYKFFHERKQWNESSEYCSAEGGHLATISSGELQDFINAFLLLNGRANAWIGLNDIEVESNYTWTDGSELNYTHWRRGEPSDDRLFGSLKIEDCVETIYGNPYVSSSRGYWEELLVSKNDFGYWNDLPCGSKLSFICQINKNKGVKKLSPDPRFCPVNEGGGFKYRKTCYHIVREKKSWEEAEKHCKENFSGHLVKILDTGAEIFLNYILSNFSTDFWIGIRMQDKTIEKWSSGWNVVYNRLSRERKKWSKGASCVLRSNDLLWTIADCSLKFPFICERSQIQAPVLKKAPEGWRCPEKSGEWLDLGGESCYIFNSKNSLLNWYGANFQCARKGGTLASINSKEEAMILQHYVLTSTEVFIGLHRNLTHKDNFEWADGSRMRYENWKPNEPNNLYKKEECGELYPDANDWNDIDCYETTGRGYICSVKKVPPREDESTSGCFCQNGERENEVSKGLHCPNLSEQWIDIDGDYCYIFETKNPLKWIEAHYECGTKGGVLTSIHSEEETNKLRPYLQNSTDSVHIGLHRSSKIRSYQKDVYEWADGSEVNYENWSPSFKIDALDFGKEGCGVMDTESMKWNDINCTSKKGYICSAEKIPSSQNRDNCTCFK